jgi:ribonuclease R
MGKGAKSLIGRFTGHAKGFGFIIIKEGGGDLFVPPPFTGGALQGDTVEYRLLNGTRGERLEAEVAAIIKRGAEPKVGTCFYEDGSGGALYVSPLDSRIPYVFRVSAKSRAKYALAEGHRVVFTVSRDVNDRDCRVVEVLGHVNDPGVDVLSLVKQSGIPYVFPEAVLAEAAKLPQSLMPTVYSDISIADGVSNEHGYTVPDTPPHLFDGRLDLRGRMIFTIDGDDTKDIDDAVSLTRNADGNYELGVHIADVAAYVTEGGLIDMEAAKRGNSVYLADRVIPMLPHTLSNGICSLNPGADRLALSCFMTIDESGAVLAHTITPSVIRSVKKWTYQRVWELLGGDAPSPIESEMLPTLRLMDELRRILQHKRTERGAVFIESAEAKIRLDDEGRVVSIEAAPHNEATESIEEFMIVCNETVAEHFTRPGVPFVYRSHEPPEPEKLKQLDAFVREFGYVLRGKNGSREAFTMLLGQAEGRPEAPVISMAVLRCQQRARYSPSLPSHYGLASECYCHFTSPIRRYADLTVHRIIHAYLREPSGTARYARLIPDVADNCSGTERAAESLEREVEQLKKTQYMRGREGEKYEGVITGAANGGLYVTLPNTIEGFIPKDETRRRERARGRSRAKAAELKLGDTVKVRVARVDEEENRVYFKPV